jgi:hypothetical protein
MLVWTLLACDQKPPEPPPPPPAAAAPSAESMLAAGACKTDGTVAAVRSIALADGRALLEVTCAMFAYQGTYEYWWPAPLKPVAGPAGAFALLGVPTVDPMTGVLTWLEKDRGPGDCGNWYRYALEGDEFVQKEHRQRACDAAGDAGPPETWPIAVAGPCGADHVVFACPTDNGKQILVCQSEGHVQYRFGAPAFQELVFPADSSPMRFTLEDRNYAQSQATVLAFENEGFVYEVTDAIGGGGENGASNNFQGVYVLKGGKTVATVGCSASPETDWDAIRALVPAPKGE